MMIRSTILLIAALMLVANTNNAEAQQNATLKWKLVKDMHLVMEMEQNMEITMTIFGRETKTKTITNSWIDWLVTEVEGDVASVDSKITRMKLEVQGPAKASVDTDDAEDEPGQSAAMGKNIRGLINAVVKQKMHSSGKVTSVQVPAEIAKAMGSAGKDMLETLSRNSSLEFPEGELTIGRTWTTKFQSPSPVGKMEVRNAYTYKGIEKKDDKELHRFAVTVEMEFIKGDAPFTITVTNQDTKGNVYFDAERGHILESRVEQNVDMTVETQGQKLDQNLKTTTKVKFVPQS